MSQVEAIYQNGVFRPLGEIHLQENQRVNLQFQPVEQKDIQEWLERVQKLQKKIIEERGYFPNSTPDIAADRMRDV